MTAKSVALLCLLALFACAKPANAARSFDNCTGFITTTPATIGSPGIWCLKQDVDFSMTGGNAITVLADNVTVACNDFAINGLAAGVATNAFGIYAENRRNVTVRNCKIRGFYEGMSIWGNGSASHTIEDNTFEKNTYLGMYVEGSGSVIRRNRVFSTGGSTLYGTAVGILTSGDMNVLDNTVSGVVADSNGSNNATGILLLGGGTISRNRVRGVVSAAGAEAGIISGGFKVHAVFRDNELVGRSREGSTGLYCQTGVSNDRVKNNVIVGFPTGIKECGGGDGNDLTP